MDRASGGQWASQCQYELSVCPGPFQSPLAGTMLWASQCSISVPKSVPGAGTSIWPGVPSITERLAVRGESTCPALDGAHWPDLLSFLPLLTRTPRSKRHSCPCSRPCQLPFPATVPPHSPVPSQASVVSGPLHSVSLPLPMPMALATLPPPQPPPPPATSPGPQLGPDALAIVERAQQMVEILTEENRALHQELQTHCESSEKLHKVLSGRGPAFPPHIPRTVWVPVLTIMGLGEHGEELTAKGVVHSV